MGEHHHMHAHVRICHFKCSLPGVYNRKLTHEISGVRNQSSIEGTIVFRIEDFQVSLLPL